MRYVCIYWGNGEGGKMMRYYIPDDPIPPMVTAEEILLEYASINPDELGEDKFDGHYDTNKARLQLFDEVMACKGDERKLKQLFGVEK